MSRLQLSVRWGLDLLVAAASFWLGCRGVSAWLATPTLGHIECAWLALGFGLVLILVFNYLDLYRQHATLLNIGELAGVLRGLALSAAVFLALLFLFSTPEGRAPAVAGILLASVFVLVERRVAGSLLKRMQLSGRLGRRVLLYGCGETGERLMKKIFQGGPALGFTVVGFLDDYATPGGTVGCRISQASDDRVQVPILGRLHDLEEVARRHAVDELLVTIPSLSPWKLAQVVEAGHKLGIAVGMVPRLGAFRADQLRVEDVSGIPILRPFAFHRRRLYHMGKRAIDLSLSVALLVFLAPAWALAWLLIRIDSPGPAIFRQQRVGLNGRIFDMYKFRTMYEDVERYARAPSSFVDPRITRVGRWVRTAGFDETPQLLNVLRGEMSLVGPRPEMPFIVEEYGELERQRLLALPGLTGLWQLSADRSSEIHQNIEYDLYYIQNRCTLLDVAILVETVFFSLSVLLHRLLRIDTLLLVGEGSVVSGETPQERDVRGGSFVLAALDQRMDGELPDRWRGILRALYAVSRDVPVKMLVAERNLMLLDDFVRREIGNGADHAVPGPEYLPHSNRSDLYRLSREAAVVVTDLAEVASWAADGIEVLMVGGGGPIRRENGGSEESGIVRAVRAELDAALAERAEPDAAPAERSGRGADLAIGS